MKEKEAKITRAIFCEGSVQLNHRVVGSVHFEKDKVDISVEGPWVWLKTDKQVIRVPMTHIKQLDYSVE